MSLFNIDASIARARERFGEAPLTVGGKRRPRSDRGRPRVPAVVIEAMAPSLHALERPPFAQMRAAVAARCQEAGCKTPARATLYALIARAPAPSYAPADLPAYVRETLYNLPGVASIPAPQLVFHCFNYGGVTAMSFASGLPWLALYQAARLRGWRPKSRGVLLAVMRLRGI